MDRCYKCGRIINYKPRNGKQVKGNHVYCNGQYMCIPCVDDKITELISKMSIKEFVETFSEIRDEEGERVEVINIKD